PRLFLSAATEAYATLFRARASALSANRPATASTMKGDASQSAILPGEGRGNFGIEENIGIDAKNNECRFRGCGAGHICRRMRESIVGFPYGQFPTARAWENFNARRRWPSA